MGSFSLWHWVIVLVVVLIVFGTGKLPKAMGDLAKGMQAFRKGLKDDSDDKQVVAAKEGEGAPRA
ncbi:twin-arginine translocase TatA/TatE family subunit [Aerophototrophica crusticola]|uniref:Sec-independent protein translocase protein TatA n=1 Tax=Aerophototrophica crusticola TaxID=1709002 RepID=A0A858R4S0_9PROT|nr:twin-arginine translocase TatA/TatE family subunit [Rhodospirillaceae bacterium B3]